MLFRLVLLSAIAFCCTPLEAGPLMVFILAGQSNMEGQGAVKTIDWLGEDEQYGHLLGSIKSENGEWIVRDDVWVHYQRANGELKTGPLTVGFGVHDECIGPELMFGHVLGDHCDDPVLIIKTCWGGRSLAEDFRPPSAEGATGATYSEMIALVESVLADPSVAVPDYDADAGYELAGFVWFQGWNDLIDDARVAEYESNLTHFIRDVRRDLNAPDLPFVIAELGVGGPEEAETNENMRNIRAAQAAPAANPEFAGSVAHVATSEYWDHIAQDILDRGWINRVWVDEELKAQFDRMGNQPPYHYLGSGKIMSLVGFGCGEAMVGLMEE
jgi:hypothetical protein